DVIHAAGDAGALPAVIVEDAVLDRDVCTATQVQSIAARIVAGNPADSHVARAHDIHAVPLLAAGVFGLAHMEDGNGCPGARNRDVRRTDVEHSHAIGITRVRRHGYSGVHEHT